MTTGDWILDIALIAVVFRQLRQTRIGPHFVLVPLGLVAYSAHSYLHTIPTGGNDLLLIVLFGVVGAALGLSGGLLTRVRPTEDGRHATAQARFWAAFLWVAGMGGRLAFILWVEHGGAPAVERFSAAHHLSGQAAWTSALIVMVFAEVGMRIGTIVLRGHLAVAHPPAKRFDLAA